MKMSKDGLLLLRQGEGFKNHVYPDSGGAPTIGVGHLLTKSEKSSGKIVINGESVKFKSGLSDQQVLDLLTQDLNPAEDCVNELVRVPLKQNQFDALVSFTFNVGEPSFRNSTLLKSLNAGLYDRVPEQLKRWVYDNGKRVDGLVNRRNNEIGLWLNGYSN